MSTQHKCQAPVYRAGSFHSSPCRATAKVERNGKHYCGRHDPVAVKAKQDARNAEFDRRRKERQANMAAASAAQAEQERRAGCYPELLEALQTMYALFKDCAEKPHELAAVDQSRAAIAKAERRTA